MTSDFCRVDLNITTAIDPANNLMVSVAPTLPESNQLCTAQDFCQQPLATKQFLLRQLGLERYGQLLSQLQPTPGNLACLEKFLSRPHQIKFPSLQGTDLEGLNLSDTNLIRADFTDANLRGCHLENADVMFGNFSRADLRGANLKGATLQEARWLEAIVGGCDLRGSKGIAPSQQQQLLTHGAIF
jgi:uncharacterized protein YjbI with pentapeptide repeats